MDSNSYDAIVVGTGISGGWAAKELTEHGLKTLVLDRGRMVRHGDYPTALLNPWELPYGGRPTREDLRHQPVAARTGYVGSQASKHWFVDELDNPYVEKQRFDWIRGYQVGGRSITWGRQSYRWSQMDFEANARDGIAVDWPIRYDDLAPWYDHVESFIGVSGSAEDLPQLPDGKFLPPMELNCVEKEFQANGCREVWPRADYWTCRPSDRTPGAQPATHAPANIATCASAAARSARTSAATPVRCRRRKKPAT